MSEGTEVDVHTKVVYIDDNIEAAHYLQNAFSNFCSIDLRNDPEWAEKFDREAANADVIVMDWNLDSVFEGKTAFPRDGKALNEVIRSMRRKNNQHPLYTIFSGALDEVADPGRYSSRPHSLAQLLDADWVGDKNKGEDFRRQLLMLSSALWHLRENPWVPATTPIQQYWGSLFAIGSNAAWSTEALTEIERYQPPIQHLCDDEGERDEPAFLRWLTRLVFPYPTFLLDTYEVAVRLRLHPEDLAKLVAHESTLFSRALAPVQYGGILAGFQGRRWWRAGLDEWLWEITSGNPFDLGVLKAGLVRVTGEELKLLDQRDPVLIRDEFGRPFEEHLVGDASEAIRIQPPDWPASISWPWTLISEARKDPVLKLIILPDDSYRLENAI